MIYILSILLLLSLIILFIQIKEKKQLKENKIEDLKDYFRKEWEEEETQLNQKKTNKLSAIENECLTHEFVTKEKINKLDFQIKNLETQLVEKEKRYNEVNQDLDLYRKGKIEEIDAGLIELTHKKEILLENEFKEKREGELKKFDEIVQFLTEQKTQINEEVETLKKELDEFRLRRAAINEEILRQKQIEEQQDFYRIQLDPNEVGDIEILRDTARRLQRPEIINKIIWSGYYQKPLAELRKRLLPNGDISGVYKITRLKTNEIYIGQTTSIDKRWQEHVKSALGVGTLASSQLHRVMAADGCENFTFEVLEETPKEKLRERESYYIDFYDSKNYGLNSVRGDK
jgi:predicted GIY-YIG superfamily endonuclease